jgi:basic amino acid/polyamine antiporter, APA family
MAAETAEGLRRELNLGQAGSLVVGIVIGSGIFIGSNRLAQGVSEPWMVFLVWAAAGGLTILGALVYAEFGALFPKSGGDYVYARESLGPFWGFFNGWLTFAINYPASLAALALAWSSQLDLLKPDPHRVLVSPDFALKFTAVALLAIFAIVNYFGVRQGGWTQLGVTAGKVLLILGLIAVGLFAGTSDPGRAVAGGAAPTATLAVAFVGALWALDGWTGVTKVAGEVREPQRNIPRALILGMLGVLAIYMLLSLAYLSVLGFDGMRGTGVDGARAVASRTADALFGTPGKVFVSILILVSILGPINGLTLAGPRVYFAMARDRLFPTLLGRVHPRHRVPHTSLAFQFGLSALLILFFTFEQLSSYVVLASWTAYAITAIGLIRLRVREPGRARPYRVPAFPLVPIVFILLSTAFIVYLFVSSLGGDDRILGLPTDTFYFLANVGVMALAVPVYRLFVHRSAAPG